MSFGEREYSIESKYKMDPLAIKEEPFEGIEDQYVPTPQSTLLSPQSTSKDSTMTHEAFNAFDVKEEISEVEEETSPESVKESHSSDMQEESGSVVVLLPVQAEDITEVKEETQDPLLMAGGWYVRQYILIRRGD